MANLCLAGSQYRTFSPNRLPPGVSVEVFNHELKIDLALKSRECVLHIVTEITPCATVECQDSDIGRAIPAHTSVATGRINPGP
jgi:hypothetical protein